MIKKSLLLFLIFFNFGFITQFGNDVNDSINRGLQYLRQTQNIDGGWGRPTGLAILCFLEKRVSADSNAQISGYTNMSPEDQIIVKNGIKYCINNINGVSINNAEAYDTGSCLMAISSYLSTGGPDLIGARMSVTNALNHAVETLKVLQARSDRMGFAYNINNLHTDMSTTQFGMAGLYAAARINQTALNTLSLSRSFIIASRNNNGGSSYQPNGTVTHAMSASGIWTLLLSGLPVEDNLVQQSLLWLRNNFSFNNTNRAGDARSYFYYLWTTAKALEISTGNIIGMIYNDQIGGFLNPVDLGYENENARWYFDFAYTLINIQNQDGSWCNNNYQCWNQISATSYSLLVLMRSLGGVCIGDEDLDEFCNLQDNCPNISNPDQTDSDGDGIGDACDNCFDIVNIDQQDLDNDNIGDACDPLICIFTNDVDICDGTDQDCDGLIDEDFILNENTTEYCVTGQYGNCSYGILNCILGSLSCVPYNDPTTETCNYFDDDCDGLIDENTINQCGQCGNLQNDICDGIDQDCDGIIDNGENLCPDYMVCYNGSCKNICDIECPQQDTFCYDELNICLYPCDYIICDRDEVCINDQFGCINLCDNILCQDNLICWQGECVEDTCEITGCEQGSICYDNECIPDVCIALECDINEFCRNGQCIESCAYISCKYNETCYDGLCIENSVCENCENLCLSLTCDISDTCINGQCVEIDCDNINCPYGQTCVESINGGQCIRTINETQTDMGTNTVNDMFIDTPNDPDFTFTKIDMYINDSYQSNSGSIGCNMNNSSKFDLLILFFTMITLRLILKQKIN